MNIRVALLLVIAGCGGSSSIRTHDLGSGEWELDCSAPLSRCSDEAAKLCKDRGYDVVSGEDQRKLYGHASGESQVEVRTSRLHVVCRGRDNEPRIAPSAPTPALPPPAAAPAPKEPGAPRACTPGTTQKCYGPGACEGGQSCLPDGAGFAPCDCGKVPAPPPSSAPAF